MIRIFGHPAFEQLSRYADGDLPNTRRGRVAAHLASCERCRDTIRFIRELGDAARSLPAPEPPADSVARFIARRAAGERVILPTSGPVPIDGERKRLLPAIAAVVTLVIAGTLFVSVPRVDADRSRLVFEPERPHSGETVDVEYEAGTLLRSEATLVVRGRFRYAGGKTEIREIGRLTREDDHAFHGRFTLPDSAVYAVFAVEDTAAARVDSNSRRLWELVVHDDDGTPLFEALRERSNELTPRNWELAYETARLTTQLYPNRVWGWHARFSFERKLQKGPAQDSLIQIHRKRLDRLDQFWSRKEPSHDDVAFLALYAMVLGDSAALERWRTRAVREAIHHPVGIQFRLLDVQLEDNLDTSLNQLEELWRQSGGDHRALVIAGFETALAAADPKYAFTWATRFLTVAPGQAAFIAKGLAGPFEGDTELLQWMEQATRLVSDRTLRPRPLYENRKQYEYQLVSEVAELRGILGEQLVASGNVDAGFETLLQAANAYWNSTTARHVAEFLAARGQFDQAAEYLARIAVDPLTEPEARRRTVAKGRRWIGRAAWESAMTQARNLLIERVNVQAVHRQIRSGLRVTDRNGRSVDLDAVLPGPVSLVAFWSPASAPAVEALPRIDWASKILERHGISTVMISTAPTLSEALRPSDGGTPTTLKYFDSTSEVALAFEQWGTPQFFVVDQNRIIRFRYSTLDESVRQAVILLTARQNRMIAPE